MTHTPGKWEASGLVIQAKDINRTCDSCGVPIHEDDPNPRCIYCWAHISPQYINIAKTAFNFCPDVQLDPEWAEGAPLEAEATANARLIASAPALLVALKHALVEIHWLLSEGFDCGIGDCPVELFRDPRGWGVKDIIDEITIAIDTATGEQIY